MVKSGRAVLVVASMLLVASCDGAGPDHASVIQKQAGRFTVTPASDGYPPLIVDTVAGCVMALKRAEDGTLSIDEVNFPNGTSSCRASHQVPVVDTLKGPDQ